MTVFIHIIFAIISLCYATYTSFVPSRIKLRMVYLFTTGTVISGVVLGFEKEVGMAHACISGLFYLGYIVVAVLLTKRRLSAKIVSE